MKGLRIDVDGTCTPLDEWATTTWELFEGATQVVRVNHPTWKDRPALYQLVVDDNGLSKELPVNRKAWALYGGSPIVGPAVLIRDDERELADGIVAGVSSDDFPGARLEELMRAYLAGSKYPGSPGGNPTSVR